MKRTRLDSESKNPSLGWVGEAPRILVIQQKMIGDVLVSSLICENLKRNYPNSEVHYLINRFTIPVIENNPYIDEIIVFEDLYRSNKIEFFKFLKDIKKRRYDVVIDAYGKLESNLTTLSSGAKTKISWEKSYTKFIYSTTVKPSNISNDGYGSAIENRIKLIKGFKDLKIFSYQPKIYLTENELIIAEKKINELYINKRLPLVMIAALGSHVNKTYPISYMAEVLDFIVLKTSAILFLNYIPSQKKEIEKLYNLCQEKTKKHIQLNFYSENLREFLAILKSCKAIIGNEGGSINMGKALNIPTFSIFSPQIKKEGWNSFEDENLEHSSTHIDDYRPEKAKNDPLNELYKEFKPRLFLQQLKLFLFKNVSLNRKQF
jgi:heptosyltransferase-2